MLEYTFTKREKGKQKMQKADLFLQYVKQFETVQTEYRKLASQWNKEIEHGSEELAETMWQKMEGLKAQMITIKTKADKLKVKK